MVRDYFYIEDGAEAYMTLAEQIKEKKLAAEAFNFSNEEPLTVLEIVDKVIEVMGSELEPEILNEASNEIEKQYLSAKKARDVQNWTPSHNMEEGLEKTVEWYNMLFDSE